jgi:hypothetical protein
VPRGVSRLVMLPFRINIDCLWSPRRGIPSHYTHALGGTDPRLSEHIALQLQCHLVPLAQRVGQDSGERVYVLQDLRDDGSNPIPVSAVRPAQDPFHSWSRDSSNDHTHRVEVAGVVVQIRRVDHPTPNKIDTLRVEEHAAQRSAQSVQRAWAWGGVTGQIDAPSF